MAISISDGWRHCPAGAIGRLASELTARRLRNLWLTRLAIGVSAVLVTVAGLATAEAVHTRRVASSIPQFRAKCGSPTYDVPGIDSSHHPSPDYESSICPK